MHFLGIENRNDTLISISNQNNVFEIGSISKVFTSTLLADFVLNNKLNLNDSINSYLQVSIKNNTPITFAELANHTSGLPPLPSNMDLATTNPNNPYKNYTDKELNLYLKNHLELNNKGTYQYSNLGAGLLGYTLSKIANTQYEELLQERIFNKFKMNQTTSSLNSVNGKLVKGLGSNGEEVANWEFSALAGAGSILSTVKDLSTFVVSQFKNKQLHLTRLKTFEVNKKMDIGLGWHILKSQSKNLWHFHNGGTGGYTSFIVIDITAKNGVIILSNVSAFNPNSGNIDELGFSLMKPLN